MKAERLLPVILVILGAALFFHKYQQKTAPVDVPPAYAGEPAAALFYQHDCVKCHTLSRLPDARGTLGPGLDGIGERAATFREDGDARAYIRQSIVEPAAVVRKGFVNAMPSFRGKLSEQELELLVDWLASGESV